MNKVCESLCFVPNWWLFFLNYFYKQLTPFVKHGASISFSGQSVMWYIFYSVTRLVEGHNLEILIWILKKVQFDNYILREWFVQTSSEKLILTFSLTEECWNYIIVKLLKCLGKQNLNTSNSYPLWTKEYLSNL